MTRFDLYHDDALVFLRRLRPDCVDAIVTDPPYLIGFMGKAWDSPDNVAGRAELWTLESS